MSDSERKSYRAFTPKEEARKTGALTKKRGDNWYVYEDGTLIAGFAIESGEENADLFIAALSAK